MSLLSREACKQKTLNVLNEKSKQHLRTMIFMINEASEKGYFSVECKYQDSNFKYMLDELRQKGYTCKVDGKLYDGEFVVGNNIVKISWD